MTVAAGAAVIPSYDELARMVAHERSARLAAERRLDAQTIALAAANRRLQLCAAQDDESRAEAREHASRLADSDALTGLANRACFVARSAVLTRDMILSGRGCALLLVDLDRFRALNDTFGQEAGDVVLRHVALKLFTGCNQADVVARLGDDKFALLLPLEEGSDIERIAGALLHAVREPVTYRGQPVEVSCSIGVARFPQDAPDLGQLHALADLALRRSKLVRSTVTIFQAEIGREHEARLALSREIAQAIRCEQIEAWFQPIHDVGSGRIVGAEALARWRHPTRGLLAPGQFLAVAEEQGQMHGLFGAMLRSASPHIARWVERGALASVSLNVSPSQFIAGENAEAMACILDECGLPASALTLEVTEEVLLQDFAGVNAQLQRLAGRGTRIALDDFGVGYSNIGYLRQLSFHTLKIDRSLTANVASERKVRSILSAIVRLARSLELDLVAEGVETAEQSACLARLGMRRQQGYWFGRPMPAAAFERALAGPVRAG